jgi:hypothetical protein
MKVIHVRFIENIGTEVTELDSGEGPSQPKRWYFLCWFTVEVCPGILSQRYATETVPEKSFHFKNVETGKDN